MGKLSVIILTHNEEQFIEEAIESVAFADEIVVVDSNSTDKTPELARKYDVVFIQREFKNFSDQRFFAVKQTTNNMVLFVDADERVSNLLKEEICEVLNNENLNSAYQIFIDVVFMGRKMKYGGFQNNWKLRLFNKNKCWYDESLLVHEKLIVKEGEASKLRHCIIHHTYRSWNHYINKKQIYADLQSQELYDKGVNVTVFHFLIKPAYRFLYHYFLRRGFLDGFPGFVWAFGSAFGVGARYVKLWLLNHGLK